MKKSIIIVITISIVILGTLIFFGKSDSVLKNKISEAKIKATEASLKAFVLTTMSDMVKYYFEEKNTTPYAENSTKKQLLETKLNDIKVKNEGNYEYRIYDDPEGDTSIKAAEILSGIYVCVDSKDVKAVNITEDEFEKSTNCSGGPLK